MKKMFLTMCLFSLSMVLWGGDYDGVYCATQRCKGGYEDSKGKPPMPTPEPASIGMAVAGLGLLYLANRK